MKGIYLNDHSCLLIFSCSLEMELIGLYATFVHIQAKLGQENLLRMVR